MPRKEFSRKVKAAVFLRAAGRCEKCAAKLKTGEGDYDHVLPDALDGLNDEANCELICKVCHKAKTGDDVRRIRKADRQRDKHDGTFKKGQGFRKAYPTRTDDDGTVWENTGLSWRRKA